MGQPDGWLWKEIKSPNKKCGLQCLARAVHDAFGSIDYFEANKAINWLKGYSKDFRDVCEYAGRNPKYVHDKLIKEVMKREQYFHNLKFESSERRRINEARKVNLQS